MRSSRRRARKRSWAPALSLGVAEASMYQARPERSAARVFTQGMPWTSAKAAWKASRSVAWPMRANCSTTAVLSTLASR